ncbi:MAG: hypothetical protein SGPRY_000489 [Prymnesium sp.]
MASEPSLAAGMVANLMMMQAMQEQRSLTRLNQLADTCFDQCVTDFSLTRQLGSSEQGCLQSCTEKYLAFSVLAGDSFLSTLEKNPRFKAG